MDKTRLGVAAVALVVPAFSLTLAAQPQRAAQSTGAQADVLKNLKFRNLGPANAGGRVTAVVGLPGQPNIYYVGAAAGGVFKTEDGGNSWAPIFTDQATASIGDTAIAPSDPNVIWVGTGEANIRNDVIDGRGVFRSTDGGHSWTAAGLPDAGQISRVIVSPTNPMDVFVAAVGHAWGPNATRGVFHTTDGGRTWTKVLYVNDSTGAADLEAEPGNPMVLFAGMWQVRRYPWELEDGGEGSGLYRSVDGGATWKRLRDGLPDEPLGRIAVALAPSKPTRVYALVEAKKGLLWSSDDLGEHWAAVSDSHELDVRPFYFSRMLVSPQDEAKVYFLSFPTVPVFDVQFVKPSHDLVVATHGRGLFVLDDMRPLEQMAARSVGGALYAFETAPGTIHHFWSSSGFARADFTAPNPPDGAIVDYLLEKKLEATPEQTREHQTPVRITVSDGSGATIATFYGPSEAGLNRAVWNMRYDPPTKLAFEPPPPENEFVRMNGPRVVPGTYTITIAANGASANVPATVRYDPAQKFDPAELRAQTEAALQVRNDLNALNEMLNRIAAMQKEIQTFEDAVRDEKDRGPAVRYQPIAERAKALDDRLQSMRNGVYNPAVQHQVIEDDIHYLAGLHGQLEGMYQGFNWMFGQAPNDLMRQQMADLHNKVAEQLAAFNNLLASGVAAYNQLAFQNGAPTLFAGQPIAVRGVANGDNK